MKEQLNHLIPSQLETWDLAAKNYAGLSEVMTKEIPMDGYHLLVQFNPERIRSSAAKVDVQSIRERKCFLCAENRPEAQKGLPFPPDYTILVNPYPIFPRHLTIPDNRHTDQLISGRINDMLLLSKDLDEYVLFYNGPKSGASAPDHFHFQAGNKGLMPVENDFFHFSGKKICRQESEGTLYTMEHYLRKTLILESSDREWIVSKFDFLLSYLRELQPQEVEPMINILVLYTGSSWQLFLFPRIKHRPSQFFEEGEKQILFSPASVDFGGLLIVPREDDFHKLNREIIVDMFSQITLPDHLWQLLLEKI